MDPVSLASGDNVCEVIPTSPGTDPGMEQKVGDSLVSEDITNIETTEVNHPETNVLKPIVPDYLDDNEINIKERIAECRGIIESLKLELSAEKTKADREKWIKRPEVDIPCVSPRLSDYPMAATRNYVDLPYGNDFYSASIDSKLSCDENLIQYERQLQKYQNTLNLAQIEKRNVIRKQMLAKAFKLKLMEIENQCNTELIRVKQSMQCLEPLKLVASSWSLNTENSYNLDNYELMPRYPEMNCTIGVSKEALESQVTSDKSANVENDLSVSEN